MSFFQINTPDLVEKRTLISQRIRSSTAGKKYRIVGQTTRGWVPTIPLPRAPAPCLSPFPFCELVVNSLLSRKIISYTCTLGRVTLNIIID